MMGRRKVGAEVVRKLNEATDAALDWARENGVAFDKAITEAIFLSRRRKKPMESVRVGDYEVQFNQHGDGSESGSTPK